MQSQPLSCSTESKIRSARCREPASRAVPVQRTDYADPIRRRNVASQWRKSNGHLRIRSVFWGGLQGESGSVRRASRCPLPLPCQRALRSLSGAQEGDSSIRFLTCQNPSEAWANSMGEGGLAAVTNCRRAPPRWRNRMPAIRTEEWRSHGRAPTRRARRSDDVQPRRRRSAAPSNARPRASRGLRD